MVWTHTHSETLGLNPMKPKSLAACLGVETQVFCRRPGKLLCGDLVTRVKICSVLLNSHSRKACGESAGISHSLWKNSVIALHLSTAAKSMFIAESDWPDPHPPLRKQRLQPLNFLSNFIFLFCTQQTISSYIYLYTCFVFFNKPWKPWKPEQKERN